MKTVQKKRVRLHGVRPCKTNKNNNNKQSTSQNQKFNENIENNNMSRTYCVSGVYPNDVRNELISDSNDDVVNMPRDSDKLDSRCYYDIKS